MREMKNIFQKSIVSITDIPKGTVITQQMIGIKKPGTGIPPSKLQVVLGKKTKCNIQKDNLISENDLI